MYPKISRKLSSEPFFQFPLPRVTMPTFLSSNWQTTAALKPPISCTAWTRCVEIFLLCRRATSWRSQLFISREWWNSKVFTSYGDCGPFSRGMWHGSIVSTHGQQWCCRFIFQFPPLVVWDGNSQFSRELEGTKLPIDNDFQWNSVRFSQHRRDVRGKMQNEKNKFSWSNNQHGEK